jgi:hypothetical protein
MVLAILKPSNEGIAEKLRHLSEEFGEEERVTQQAFSKQRMMFDHSPFEAMARELIRVEYSGKFKLPQFNGYHILAVDGSKMPLPNTPELREKYGTFGSENCVKVGISALYDAGHRYILDAALYPAGFNEREAMKAHVDFVVKNIPLISGNCIFTADRGYASLDVSDYLLQENVNFCIRISTSLNITKEAMPGITNVKVGEHSLTLVTVELENGNREYLLTNVSGFSAEQYAEIYHMRWNIETEFDVVKNKIGLEGLSGKSDNTLKQDFWAAITVANMLAAAYSEAVEKVRTKRENKANKYVYQPNVTHIVSVLKDEIIKLLVDSDPDSRKRRFLKIQLELSRSVVPIRKNRSAPRNPNNCKKCGFSSNRKRV